MAVTAAVLLLGEAAFALYSLLSPSSDPERGMANGFSCLAIVVFGGLGTLLVFGVRRGRRGIVRAVFAIAALPALAPIARFVYLGIRAVTGRAAP